MKAEELYRGENGSQYHALRQGRRSDAVQDSRATLFSGLTQHDSHVVDFGCGTGGVLKRLEAKKRIGVEINEISADEAAKHLDEIYRNLSEISEASVDVAISFHALEHVDEPADVISGLYRVLRPGGLLRIIVPCEMPLLLAQHQTVRRQGLWPRFEVVA